MAQGIGVTVEIRENLSAALNQVAASAGDMTPAMKEIAVYLERVTKLRFEREEGPDGVAWRPSQRAIEEGGRTLTLTGDLQSSIGSAYAADFAEVGPERSFGAAVYAAIHQFGGTIRAAAKRALSFGGRVVASVFIPARPYVGFDQVDQDTMAEILTDHLRGLFQPRGAPA
jgi:phage virion morphogenesis protein